MKVSYTGVHNQLPPKVQAKVDAKFAKLAKLLDGRGEREAHVIVTQERHRHCAEITLQFHDHKLVGEGSDADLFTAVSVALDKLDKQAVKQRSKWREKTRRKDIPSPVEAVSAEPPKKKTNEQSLDGKRVFRVNHSGRRKPMTLDEAVLEMDKDRDYLAYRDAERGGLSVLVRRRDGHFDLIES